MELVNYNYNVQKNLEQLYPSGAFLTAGHFDDANTMTIGWGSIGISWSKKTMLIMVTHSRFTHHLLEKYHEFTVTFPYEDMSDKLMLVGSKSGRDHNKYELANLTLAEGQAIETPHIKCQGMTLECKVIFQNEIDPDFLDPTIYEKRYSKSKDLHTIYYGEVITSYLTDNE